MSMNFEEALDEIKSFWKEEGFPFTAGGEAYLALLEQQFGRRFPSQLQDYIRSIIPARSIVFESVGNPIEIYGYHTLSKRVDGYNYNPFTHEEIEGWEDSWVLIGDEGADPIIIDLGIVESDSSPCPVLQAMHGQGDWEFDEIASSLPQFILLTAARHHALTSFGAGEPIIDDEAGFRLAPPVASWLLPNIRKWDPEHYSDWASIFDNS
jgi:hypothetical protein